VYNKEEILLLICSVRQLYVSGYKTNILKQGVLTPCGNEKT